ncbi:class I SAM-dependent methyltransferase [Peterkaempfera sp. SMS 1(5)a]|uniref:class I SAM-dependent methyltransferase n=1 Tax=Peterkaempfera podocarpi TaxID=3232308 RepID=UPI0036701DC8
MTEPDAVRATRATRASCDAMAAGHADRFRDELGSKPLERALLAGFAGLVQDLGVGPIADVGCGTRRVTAYLRGLGAAAFGIDLSPQMVETAQKAHPDLRFEVGSMLALDLPDGTLGGLMSGYSTIHIPQEQLPQVFAEFRRVLAPRRPSVAGVPGR